MSDVNNHLYSRPSLIVDDHMTIDDGDYDDEIIDVNFDVHNDYGDDD